MHLPIDVDAIEYVSHGTATNWGNVFLTTAWVLHVDMTNEQHDAAMERLGIYRQDVLVSGCIHDGVVSFRSPYNNELSDDQYAVLCKAVSYKLGLTRWKWA